MAVFPDSVANPGGVVIPAEALSVSGIYPLQDVTEDSIKANYRSELMLTGRNVNTVFFDTIMSGFSSAAEIIAAIAKALGAAVPGLATATEALKSITKWAGNAVVDVTEAAVNAVVDGLNGVGQFANALSSAIMEFINKAINSIFGDGGTKWGQELLVAAGPVIEGTNDLPLGFSMPYYGTIQEIYVRTSENLIDPDSSDSKIVFEVRVNNVTKGTFTLKPGVGAELFNRLSIKAGKFDVITIFVVEASAMVADMTVMVSGKYN